MKYQFFGDTHGEVHWKQLLDPECIQVFLGDYFSPNKFCKTQKFFAKTKNIENNIKV